MLRMREKTKAIHILYPIILVTVFRLNSSCSRHDAMISYLPMITGG